MPVARELDVEPGVHPAPRVRLVMTEPFRGVVKPLLQRVLRWVYGRHIPDPVRNSLLIHLLLLRRDADPALVPAPAGRRVVVLSPHMDDEVFGCGATLALAARAGSDVVPIYLADGTKGYPPSAMAGLAPHAVREAERRLGSVRKEESRRAGEILRLGKPMFLDLPETALAVTADAVDRLADALALVEPEVVFLPFMTELNTDHWMTNAIFMEAARRVRMRPTVQCWGYEVWTPLPANTLVDIADAMDAKREAMAQFQSQIEDYAYPRAFEALAAYRSLLRRKGRGFIEAFWVAELDIYRRLYERVVVGRRRPR